MDIIQKARYLVSGLATNTLIGEGVVGWVEYALTWRGVWGEDIGGREGLEITRNCFKLYQAPCSPT